MQQPAFARAVPIFAVRGSKDSLIMRIQELHERVKDFGA